ncbi:hypothetical protein GF324_05185 [bacterium]|nr:hypothetical protein [bacterium]
MIVRRSPVCRPAAAGDPYRLHETRADLTAEDTTFAPRVRALLRTLGRSDPSREIADRPVPVSGTTFALPFANVTFQNTVARMNPSFFQRTASALLVILFLTVFAHAQEPAQYKAPEPGYEWSFPRDHGNHPAYAMEWWYYVGRLVPKGTSFDNEEHMRSVQLTFFRNALPGYQSGQFYFAHLTSAGAGQPFRFAERIARGTLGEAGADTSHMHVWLHDWRASEIAGNQLIEAYDDSVGGIRLLLTPTWEPRLNGRDGFSKKGPAGTEASLYYSQPYLKAEGFYLPRENEGGSPVEVEGWFWLDREFGNQELGEGLVGWDWFGLMLPGGDALMIYMIRRGDDQPIEQSGGTWMPKGEKEVPLAFDDYTVEATGTWTSEESGATYPSGWRITVPRADLELTVTPLHKDSELRTDRSTRVTYWEGAVRIERNGTPGRSYGFVELVGYDR